VQCVVVFGLCPELAIQAVVFAINDKGCLRKEIDDAIAIWDTRQTHVHLYTIPLDVLVATNKCMLSILLQTEFG